MSLGPCTHAIVVDEGIDGTAVCWRRCLLCGHAYNRDGLLERLQGKIRERHACMTKLIYRLQREAATGVEDDLDEFGVFR